MKPHFYHSTSLLALALTGAAGSAEANTTRFSSATGCVGNTSADTNILAIFKEGCFNFFQGPFSSLPNPLTNLCAPSAIVALPINGNNSDTVDFDAITVNYTNGSTTESISCQTFVVNASGTVFQSSALRATLAGLTPANGSLTWTGTTLPNSGNAISNVRIQTIFCILPPKIASEDHGDNGSECAVENYSLIKNYSVNTVQP